MTSRIEQVNVCDMGDGVEGDGVETVTFGLGSDEYEIELCAPHAKQLRDKVGPFADHARRSRRGGSKAKRRTTSARQHAADVRSWARGHGHPDIAERGRIPGGIVAEYEQAMTARAAAR